MFCSAALRSAQDNHPEKRVVTRHLTFLLRHYDLPSLLGGKIHALITRKYVKGRDWYDLTWYLSRRPPVRPNLKFLQNALDQTQGAGRFEASRWQVHLRKRLQTLNERAVRDDVLPFLEHTKDADLLNRENLNRLLA